MSGSDRALAWFMRADRKRDMPSTKSRSGRGGRGGKSGNGREEPSGRAHGSTYEAQAERFPIVYVPGFGAPPFHGLYFRSRLEIEGFNVREADLPYLQTGDVRKSAKVLASEVEKTLERYDAVKVNLVGHSLGGIISRYYLQKLDGWRRVHRAVYLGTPHQGVYWAVFGLMTKAGRQLLPGSRLIEELNSDPARCRNVKCLSIISNFDEMIVPRDSGILHCGYNKFVNWPVGHWGMVFSNKAVGWIVDFFDGIFDIHAGFAKVYEDREQDQPCRQAV